MKDRINKFILTENLTSAEFADLIGVQRSSVSHVLNGRNNPSFTFIQKILEVFPKLNARWLMNGEGQMYGSNTNVNHTIENEAFEEDLPDLFTPISTSSDKPLIKTTPEAIVKSSEEKVKTAVSSKIPVQPTEGKTVKKVLIFYSDHTFDEYGPAD